MNGNNISKLREMIKTAKSYENTAKISTKQGFRSRAMSEWEITASAYLDIAIYCERMYNNKCNPVDREHYKKGIKMNYENVAYACSYAGENADCVGEPELSVQFKLMSACYFYVIDRFEDAGYALGFASMRAFEAGESELGFEAAGLSRSFFLKAGKVPKHNKIRTHLENFGSVNFEADSIPNYL